MVRSLEVLKNAVYAETRSGVVAAPARLPWATGATRAPEVCAKLDVPDASTSPAMFFRNVIDRRAVIVRCIVSMYTCAIEVRKQ